MPNDSTNTSRGNPFVRPGERQSGVPNTRIPVNPFAGPPEPELTPDEAKLEALSRAWGEWREYLPHDLPRAEYEPYRLTHIRDAAISSATTPLKAAALPPEEVASWAEEAADAAFASVADLLSTFEPDLWVNHDY